MRAGRPGKALLVAVVMFAPALAAAARAQVAPCEASPKVKEALRSLPQSTGDSQADQAARVGALKALLKRYPNDVFVHTRYQDEAIGETVEERDAVIAEYRGLAARHPGDPIYTYLALRARIGVGTKERIPQLERVTGSVPSARLSLVRIYQSTNFKDPDKAREQLQAFIKACPQTLSPYNYLRSQAASAFLTQTIAKLRVLLQARTDAEALNYYGTLWAVEFRGTPPSGHDALRKQVADDLKRLRTMIGLAGDRIYYSVLQNGYKLANDAQGEKWAGQQARLHAPRGSYYAVRDEFLKANPYPKPADPPEKRKAFAKAYADASAEWVKLAPNDVGAWFDRVGALRQVDGASPADVEAAGEGLLRAVAKNPHGMSFMSPTGGSSFALVVADLYANKGVRLDRLPDLVRQGIPELELLRTIGVPDDLYPPLDTASSLNAARWYGTATVADIWIRVKDKDGARAALTELQALADKSKPKDPTDPKYAVQQRTWLSRQVTYWKALGDFAQLDGRSTDALTFYQNALLARAEPPPGGQPDDLGEKARALWKEAGGTNEGWQAWFTRKDLFGQPGADVAAAGRFTKIDKAVPEFDLTDLSGVKWRLADFKGKTTLVGIWATW
jgi:hypothetical protein